MLVFKINNSLIGVTWYKPSEWLYLIASLLDTEKLDKLRWKLEKLHL